MKVGIIMGSTSDYEVMSGAVEMLEELGVDYEQIKHKEERWANRIANAQIRKY